MFSFLFAERKSFTAKVPHLSPGTVCSFVLNTWLAPHLCILCLSSLGYMYSPMVCKTRHWIYYKVPGLVGAQVSWEQQQTFPAAEKPLPHQPIAASIAGKNTHTTPISQPLAIAATKDCYLTQRCIWSLICPSHPVTDFLAVDWLIIIQVQD